MARIETLNDFKEVVQAMFDSNEESLRSFNKFYTTQLKAYLIESNYSTSKQIPSINGRWRSLGVDGWYINDGDEQFNETFIINRSNSRVWKLFSLVRATDSDAVVYDWVRRTKNLDFCWLTRNMLFHWKRKSNWKDMGIGVKFDDGLATEEEKGHFSLKAWHGASKYFPEIDDLIQRASDRFTIHSVRYKKDAEGGTGLVSDPNLRILWATELS